RQGWPEGWNARGSCDVSARFRAALAQFFRYRRSLAVDRPIEGRPLIDRVLDVGARPPVQEQPHDPRSIRCDGLMQWSRVGMKSVRVVSIRILTRIEQRSNYLGVAVLGGERQCDVPASAVSGGK